MKEAPVDTPQLALSHSWEEWTNWKDVLLQNKTPISLHFSNRKSSNNEYWIIWIRIYWSFGGCSNLQHISLNHHVCICLACSTDVSPAGGGDMLRTWAWAEGEGRWCGFVLCVFFCTTPWTGWTGSDAECRDLEGKSPVWKQNTEKCFFFSFSELFVFFLRRCVLSTQRSFFIFYPSAFSRALKCLQCGLCRTLQRPQTLDFPQTCYV